MEAIRYPVRTENRSDASETLAEGNADLRPRSAQDAMNNTRDGIWFTPQHVLDFIEGKLTANPDAIEPPADFGSDEISMAMKPRECELFGADAERRRADQLAVNCRWLIAQMDRVHAALCPGRSGTWQDRVRQAVESAEKKATDAARNALTPNAPGEPRRKENHE